MATVQQSFQTWTINPCSPSDPPATATMLPRTGSAGSPEESMFDPDERRLVMPQDITPGGKYRAIVKLEVRYTNQAPDDERWTAATGWMISEDTLVTAAHVVAPTDTTLGLCSRVRVLMGYNGKNSLRSPTTAVRSGVKIALPEASTSNAPAGARNVAMVKLDRPFADLQPLRFAETPITGMGVLGVVGYPGDRNFCGENGAQMYEDFEPSKWDLDNASGHMLQYRISTYGGQDGSPVLIKQTGLVIGCHVGSAGGAEPSLAVPLGSKYGTDLVAMKQALGTTTVSPVALAAESVAAGIKTNIRPRGVGFMSANAPSELIF